MILLVDDEKDILDVMYQKLKMEGFCNLIKTSHAQYVLDELEDNEDIKICVVDIGMNDLSGVDLMEQISIRFPYVKIICVSGYADLFKAQLKNIGVKYIVSKPDYGKPLIKAIHNCIEENTNISRPFIDAKKRVRPTVQLPIRIDIIGTDFVEVARVQNISLGGAAFSTIREFKGSGVDNYIDIIITLSSARPFKAKGRIKYSLKKESTYTFGISFVEIESIGKELLQNYLSLGNSTAQCSSKT